MPDIKINIDSEINIDVWCDNCGAGLCSKTTVKKGSFYVEPCDCQKKEIEDLQNEIERLSHA